MRRVSKKWGFRDRIQQLKVTGPALYRKPPLSLIGDYVIICTIKILICNELQVGWNREITLVLI